MNPTNKQPDIKALSPQQVSSWPQPGIGAYTLTGEKKAVSAPQESPEYDILQLARERFDVAANYENARRLEMEQDQNFALGVQWDASIMNQRQALGRPCLTLNRTAEFLAHTVNNMRQSRPGIKINPVGDGADEEDANIRQGLIRHIESNSKADMAYDKAFENMCKMGLGWIRIVDDWAAPDSFDKELFIRWVPNPFLVYADPDCSQPDWSDMKWAFVIEDLSRAEFMARFPDEDPVSLDLNYSSVGARGQTQWFPGGKIRIAEYFHIDYKKRTIVELDEAPGTIQFLDELPPPPNGEYVRHEDDLWLTGAVNETDVRHAGRVRDTDVPVVHWDLISGVKILKRRTWKGHYIPLIPIIGDVTEANGEKIIIGMVRYAREPQRMYNYFYSTLVEVMALAPKAPFIASVGQVPDGLVEEWKKANQEPTAVLRYKAQLVEGGGLVPPPIRQQASADIASYVQGLQICDQNMKAIFRIYDASLGQRGPQESGLAINARKLESDTGTFNWGDNFVRALRLVGIQLNDLLAYYYNTPGKIIRVLQDDLTSQEVVIGQEVTVRGIQRYFDLANGKFAVDVTVGPSAPTRRTETSMYLSELVKAYPPLMQVAGDLVIKEMDFIGKDAIAARLKMALPPAIQQGDGSELPPQFQAQMSQAMQHIQLLTQALQEATDKNALEQMKQEWETLRTQMTQERQLASDAMKVGSQESQFLSQKVFDELNSFKAMLAPIVQSHIAQTIINAGGNPGHGGLPEPTPLNPPPATAPSAS